MNWRYHAANLGGIVVLGVLGSYALPQLTFEIPWTTLFMIASATGLSSFLAFVSAARYASPMLVAENARFSFFPEETRYVNDGKLVWAAKPVKGWSYKMKWLNSGNNPAVAIFPAGMMEQEEEHYVLVRCKLYHLTPQAIRVLMRKRAFRRLLNDVGFSEEKKMEVYFGFSSTTMHDDKLHGKSVTDVTAVEETQTIAERENRRNAAEVRNLSQERKRNFVETENVGRRLIGKRPVESDEQERSR